MGDIGNVNANLPLALANGLYRERIVKVLCIGWVNRQRRHTSHISTLGNVTLGYATIDGICSLLDLLLELVRQIVLKQYGVHLGIVVASCTQHIDQLALWQSIALAPIDDAYRHLIILLQIGISLA